MRDVWFHYRRELRSALRERSIVVNSILLPILLYPLLLWTIFSGLVFVQGLSEGLISRIALRALPTAHAELGDSIGAMRSVELAPAQGTLAQQLDQVASGELDAVVEFLPAVNQGVALPRNFSIRVTYDRSEDRSRLAQERVSGVMARYRDRWLDREARSLGLSAGDLEQFRVEQRNIASGSEMGAFLLGEMIPLFLVVMVALGCFVPAIDTTAGERERSTWETLMTTTSSRLSIVAGKYLYVATLGIVAGVLNVVAVTVSMGAVLRPLLGNDLEAFSFQLPALAVPVMIVGAIALALFFAAAMMILAAFARTFRDGQSMVAPVYWLALVPLLLITNADQNLTPAYTLVPIANVALMMRDAINGNFDLSLIGETVAVELVLVVLCLMVARRVLQFEDFLLGSYDGSFWRFARSHLLRRGSRDGAPAPERW